MKQKKPDPLAEILDKFFQRMDVIENKLDLLNGRLAGPTAPALLPAQPVLAEKRLTPMQVSQPKNMIDFESQCGGFIYYEPHYVGVPVGVRYDNEGKLTELFTINKTDNTTLSVFEQQGLIEGLPEEIDIEGKGVDTFIFGVVTLKSKDKPTRRLLGDGTTIKGMINQILLGSIELGTAKDIYFIPLSGDQRLCCQFADYEELLSWFEVSEFIVPEQLGLDYKDDFSEYSVTTEYAFKGVVVKNGHINKWHDGTYARTYHFTENLYSATLLGLSWQPAQDGSIDPIGVISPIIIDGESVNLCLVSNVDQLIKQGINQGTLVNLCEYEKGRLALVTPEQLGNGKRFFKLNQCPLCDSELVGAEERCSNIHCDGLLYTRLVRMTHTYGLNIEQLEDADIMLLYQQRCLNSLTDIFGLTQADLIGIGKTKKKVKGILSNIVNVQRNRDLVFWLNALGIPGLSVGRCLAIERYLKEYYEYVKIEYVMDLFMDQRQLVDLLGVEVMCVPAYTALHYNDIFQYLLHFNWTKFNRQPIGNIESVSLIGRSYVNYDHLQQALYRRGMVIDTTLTETDKCVLLGDAPAPCLVSLVSRYNITPINIADMDIDTIVKSIVELKYEM